MTSLQPIRSIERAGSVRTIVPVILCGGSGSRLWPISRKDFAKQHVPMLGGASPFQRTLSRLDRQVFARPIVISAAPARFLVADQAKEAGVEIDIALEPQGRDTLAAVTLAACLAARRDPDAIVMVMPSDHLIPDAAAFGRSASAAARLAEDGHIVVLGIPPTSPSTAYGYIAPGAQIGSGFAVDSSRSPTPSGLRRSSTMAASGMPACSASARARALPRSRTTRRARSLLSSGRSTRRRTTSAPCGSARASRR
jgi:hypothetical protein